MCNDNGPEREYKTNTKWCKSLGVFFFILIQVIAQKAFKSDKNCPLKSQSSVIHCDTLTLSTIY